jgi:hypothetical protein
MRTRIAIYVLVTAIAGIFPGTGQGQAADCPQYSDAINKIMPAAVGNQDLLGGMLKVEAIDWSGKIDPSILFQSLGEEGTPSGKTLGRAYPGIGILKSPKGTSKLKFNLPRGEIQYVNQGRSFVAENPKAFDPEKSKTLVFGLLGQLGLPENEFSLDGMKSSILRGRAAQNETMRWERDYDIETHFFIPRLVNGIPVLRSVMTVGVSNKGQISKFRARWPALAIDPALLQAKALRRTAVARAVQRALMKEQGCIGLETARFDMFIAYVPLDDDQPDKDNVPEVAKQSLYSPKLVAFLMPSTGGEGKEAGTVLEFDLFAR